MDLSILIVNYRSSHVLGECLDSVFKSETSLKYEVIVVDNHSSDEGLPSLKRRYPQVCFIDSDKNRGFSGGNNLAIGAASGDVFLLLNPDTQVEKDALAILRRRLVRDEATGIVGPKIYYGDGTLQTRHIPKKMPTLAGFFFEMFYLDKLFSHHPLINGYYGADFQYNNEQRLDQVSGACLMIKRSVVEAIGLLDEKLFLYFDEADWCMRALKKGYQVIYVPSASVRHHLGKSAGQNLRKSTWLFYDSQLYLLRKYYGAWHVISLYALNLLGFFLRFFTAPFYVCKDRNFNKVRTNAWAFLYHLNILHLAKAILR